MVSNAKQEPMLVTTVAPDRREAAGAAGASVGAGAAPAVVTSAPAVVTSAPSSAPSQSPNFPVPGYDLSAMISQIPKLPAAEGLDQVNSLTFDGIGAKIKGLFSGG